MSLARARLASVGGIVVALALVLVTGWVYVSHMVGTEGRPFAGTVAFWTILTLSPAPFLVGSLIARKRPRIALLISAAVLLVPGYFTSLFIATVPALILVGGVLVVELSSLGATPMDGRAAKTS